MAANPGNGLSPQIRLLAEGEQRLLAGIGHVDPDNTASYRDHGGYSGLERAVAHLGAEGVVEEISQARLRGRGGGGYPTADKWRGARAGSADRRIVIANLMGADPTALGDRALVEGNPHLVLEGVLIAAFATGASEAILAVRRDWKVAIARLKAAIADAERSRFAGYLVMGTDFSCQVSVWEGSGALVAGEETALLAALAGDRGMPVIRPPYPTQRGLWGAPTTIHNGETLAHVAWILSHSAEAFASVGSEASPGTRLVSIYGRVVEPGVVEVPLGMPVGEVVRLAGGATGTVKAVFVGGPGGGALAEPELSTPYDYEPLREAGAGIGLGQMLVTDTATCMVDTARFFLDWSAREACGKAVPCRIGTRRLVEALDRVLAATPRPNDFTLLRELSRKVTDTALCNLEARAPGPMLTTLARFADEYRAHAERGECLAGACRVPEVPPLVTPLPDVEPAAPASSNEPR
ncbi:MAG TPA: NADH-ubiquinone oxidoreductase-F iron-sulfur binding region domain-containing protein [Candidatus Limnocylindria bacterium]|nr:NADH-ubiquinone oxidoreductase-F iron-sulfur binding region domain-containing protein [Candidatus Limnocylindria bacterium]